MEDPVDPGFVREFQESTLAKSVPQSFFETIVQESLKLPARVWKDMVAGSMQNDFSVNRHGNGPPARRAKGTPFRGTDDAALTIPQP
ncbi:MAG: hypothetical protein RLO50_14705 [Azospirillaceae bacterium]